MTGQRWPLEPLLRAAGIASDELFKRAGIRNAKHRARYRDDGLSELMADRICTRLGLHPWIVWPEMADQAASDLELRAQRRRERDAAAKRRRYRLDPEWRAVVLARNAQRRAADPEAERQRQLAYRRGKSDRISERRRARYLANRDALLAWQRDYDRRGRAGE